MTTSIHPRDQGKTAAERGAAAEEKPGPVALLPDDVLANVLRRLPPRGLAASRCVCEAWRAVVDSRRLLRADLLPLSLGGIFINFHTYYISEFFSCPTAAGAPVVSGNRRYLPEATGCQSWGEVCDHCNGLVLVDGTDDGIWYVLNPATRWVAPLPPCPPPSVDMHTWEVKYLAYDPTTTPDYEVVSVSRLHYVRKPGDFLYDSSKDTLDFEMEQSEWPPPLFNLRVFSSRTGQWEERSFAREGEPVGTVADMRHSATEQRNAVYWRGMLYIHCQADFVMRISLASDKYQVIKPPIGIEVATYPHIYVGKSVKGVYCASIKERCRVRVWNLAESGCNFEWVLKHDKDLRKWLLKHKLEHPKPYENSQKIRGPWILQDINYYYSDEDGNIKARVEEEFECSSQASEDEKSSWSSDDEYISGDYYHGCVEIIGFHPFEEIIFLGECTTRGLAYHFNSSKVEVLGNIYPEEYADELLNEQFITSSFPYTPCWLGKSEDDSSLKGFTSITACNKI